MSQAPLVTVIIPAYDAEETIDETLRSVRAQTYRKLEIIVVDDGSTDRTFEIVKEHTEADRRVRVICQTNSGVAAARNRAIEEAQGEFIAPIDADDLWHPTKIEKQVAEMLRRGPRVGLVYTWQARIDERGGVISAKTNIEDEGNVFTRMLQRNLVGSASPPLMRKKAVIEAGGYDTSLRARGAEGCEDRQLYAAISEYYEFALIREFLTGYRIDTRSMSWNIKKMAHSFDLVASDWRAKYPQWAADIAEGHARQRRWLLLRALRQREFSTASILFMLLLSSRPRYAGEVMLNGLRSVSNMVERAVRPAAEEDAGLQREPFLPACDWPSRST